MYIFILMMIGECRAWSRCSKTCEDCPGVPIARISGLFVAASSGVGIDSHKRFVAHVYLSFSVREAHPVRERLHTFSHFKISADQ